jgi:hypothetical protein
MKPGDLVKIRCSKCLIPYDHYGIFTNVGTVVELAGNSRPDDPTFDLSSMCVRESSLEEFARGKEVIVEECAESFSAEEVILNARSRLGTSDYSIFRSNCEHFARWCKTGKASSRQIEAAAHVAIQTVSCIAYVAVARSSPKMAFAFALNVAAQMARRKAVRR